MLFLGWDFLSFSFLNEVTVLLLVKVFPMFRRGLSCCRVELSFFSVRLVFKAAGFIITLCWTTTISSSMHHPRLSTPWLSPTSITVGVTFHVQNPYCLVLIQYLLSQSSYVWTLYPGLLPASPTLGVFCFCHVLWKPYAWAPYSSTDIFLESTASSECCRTPGFQTP